MKAFFLLITHKISRKGDMKEMKEAFTFSNKSYENNSKGY